MPTSEFLDWNRPLLPAVAEKLLADCPTDCADLSDTLVIVPTAHSGRRLREVLALAVAKRARGLFPPEIVTPDLLLVQALPPGTVASDSCVAAAWTTVLAEIDPEHFQALFPVAPIRTTGWRLGVAQRFMQLRDELGEEGLDFAEVARRCADTGHEPERWRQLARLESLYYDELRRHKLDDPKQGRRRAADTYRPPAHIRRIVLAATPDPQPLPLAALSQAEKAAPVEVWVYGNDADLFDDWGRPIPERWSQRPLDWETWRCRIETFANPKALAGRLAESTRHAEPESVLIGLADAELNPVVADAMRAAGTASYDPEGYPVHLGGVGRLAELLCQLSEEADTATVRELLQHPDLHAWLSVGATQTKLLAALDRVFEKHLCADLGSLLHFARHDALQAALRKIAGLEQNLRRQNGFGKALAATLRDIYAKREIKQGVDGSNWKDHAKAVRERIERLAEAEERFADLSGEFARAHFKQQLKATRTHPDRPREAHDLLGWLELLWNDAPHLILAGINEGIVPENVVGDAFLPESLREQLGLRTNSKRLARDAYLFEALCRRRVETGRIDLLVPHAAADNSPLKPSRLLFLGAPGTLLPRARALFKAPDSPGEPRPHDLPWILTPPPGLPLPEKFSISALSTYLECPFRFFLRHILGMRSPDLESRELSPAAFGNLFHDSAKVLSGLHLDRTSKAGELAAKLHAIADELIHQRYGRKLSFALRLQREALMARLEAFAEVQVADIRQNGSIQITDTEHEIDLDIEGTRITGRIDRIDRRGDQVELIDYKTSDQPTTPAKAHLAAIGRKTPPRHLPPEAYFEHEGKEYRWTDLQLPLYVLATRESGGARPTVAYFNLPKTLDKSGIERWDDFTESHLESARNCAAALLRQIKAGRFWPPNEKPQYDDFAPIFPDGIENSVDAQAFEKYRFAAEEPKVQP